MSSHISSDLHMISCLRPAPHILPLMSLRSHSKTSVEPLALLVRDSPPLEAHNLTSLSRETVRPGEWYKELIWSHRHHHAQADRFSVYAAGSLPIGSSTDHCHHLCGPGSGRKFFPLSLCCPIGSGRGGVISAGHSHHY